MGKKEKVSKVEIRSFSPTVNIIFNILIALFAISCVLPFFFVVMISLTEETFTSGIGLSFLAQRIFNRGVFLHFCRPNEFKNLPCFWRNDFCNGFRDTGKCHHDITLCVCDFAVKFSFPPFLYRFCFSDDAFHTRDGKQRT